MVARRVLNVGTVTGNGIETGGKKKEDYIQGLWI